MAGRRTFTLYGIRAAPLLRIWQPPRCRDAGQGVGCGAVGQQSVTYDMKYWEMNESESDGMGVYC